MFTLLKTLRYLVFALFIIFNAVVASVGVWNRSIAEGSGVGWNSNIDIYFVILGGLGLVVIFGVIFTELAWKHGISGRIWFECTWMALFWVLYLTAATAMTVLFPARTCISVGGVSPLPADACASGRALLGVSWAMCVMLFFYLVLLVFATYSNLHDNPEAWHSYAHKISWGPRHRNLPSNPPTPSAPRFMQKMPPPPVVAPKPKHIVPTQVYNTGRFGLEEDYEIESYATPAPGARGLPGPLPPPARLGQSSLGLHIPSEPSGLGTSFYPTQVQSVLTPLEPQRPENRRPHLPAMPSPPPLGEWPRANPTTDTIGRRRPTVRAADPAPLNTESYTQQELPMSGTSPPRERPIGPRRRSEQDGRTHQYSNSASLQR